jgi:hypothetical protein
MGTKESLRPVNVEISGRPYLEISAFCFVLEGSSSGLGVKNVVLLFCLEAFK